MSRVLRAQTWTPRVRAAIARTPDPFSARDLCQAMGISPRDDAGKRAVLDVLLRLSDMYELGFEEHEREGRKRPLRLFRRTSSFRAAEFDFEAQKRAALELQAVCLAWGGRRKPSQERHAAD